MCNFLRIVVVLCVCIPISVFSANPNYSYHVQIEDPHEANFQQKAETRLGEKAHGFYSVVEPNGALRTVNYIADENGFQPTITYSYGHPVPAVKKILASPALAVVKQPQALGAAVVKQHAVPAVTLGAAVVKQHTVPAASYQQVFTAPIGAYHTFTGDKTQYASTYGTPVFSVKESRQFIKNPIVAQHAAKILASPQVVYQQPQFVPHQAEFAFAVPQQQQVIVQQQPQQFVAVPQQQVTYLPPQPAPAPPPVEVIPEPVLAPVPVPSQKLEYLPPAPTKVKVVKDGYTYPVPQKQLAYPVVEKVQSAVIAQPQALVEIPAPIIETPPPAVVKAVEPAPHTIIKAHPPAQVQQYIEFGARLQPQPQFIPQPQQFAVQQAVPVQQYQPVYQQHQYIAQAPVYQQQYIQPQFSAPAYPVHQYTHNPAQVYHQQAHFQQVQQFIQAQQPQIHYAPQHQAYVAPEQPIIEQQPVPLAVAQPAVVQKYEDIVLQNQGIMRYAAAPVAQYLEQPYIPPPQPALVQKVQRVQSQYITPVQQTLIQKAQAPVVSKVALSSPALFKGKQNPLTFNYGYDNGVSKVSHSYFGSGW